MKEKTIRTDGDRKIKENPEGLRETEEEGSTRFTFVSLYYCVCLSHSIPKATITTHRKCMCVCVCLPSAKMKPQCDTTGCTDGRHFVSI